MNRLPDFADQRDAVNTENLAQRLAQLSPAKRALLELKVQQARAGRTAGGSIPRRADKNYAPLSFAQQRLWFLNQLEPESFAYNETSALRLEGHLDVDVLQRALNAIVERHEVLRTTIVVAADGTPLQRIGTEAGIDALLIDLSEQTEQERETEVQRRASELKARPFDLSKDLPVRVELLRLKAEQHVLIVVKHHIASDGWSSGVFARELAALYNAFSQAQPSPLAELPIQYADYAQWQREWLEGEQLEKQLAYWKEQLRDVTILELPTDRPRSQAPSERGGRQFLELSQALSDRLKSLGQSEGATLYMTLLAAFQILLHRYTGQDDIIVGSPIAGRTRIETEGLIGFFVNTLLLRTDLAGDPTYGELLARVRKTALQAYEHQDLPFEKLIEEINPDRGQGDSPMLRVSFALQNTPRQVLNMAGLTATPIEIEALAAKFELSVAFVERDHRYVIRIEYRADLFDAATIERMLGHFRNLLEGIVANPEQRINELPLLTEAERHQLLVEWNDTKRDYPSDKCIHQLFEEQVERTPEAAAVVFEDQQLTYRELNNRANQLAHYLRKLGVGPEVLVGICVERSIEMVVGLLGILKAGGVYVPLDPSYPRERLGFMLQDSGSPVLITQQALVDVFIGHTGKIISLDTDWKKIGQGNEGNLVLRNFI